MVKLGAKPHTDDAVGVDGNDIDLDRKAVEGGDQPFTVHDIKRLSTLYQAFISRKSLRLCRSVPLEILLVVLASDNILMPLQAIIDALPDNEEIVMRWLEIMVSGKILLKHLGPSGVLMSLAPDYATDFVFEI